MFNHAFKKTPVWVADTDGTLHVEAQILNTPYILAPLHGVDSITLSVKKPGVLLGKTTFNIKGDSIISGIHNLYIPVGIGDSIYVEYHIPNRNLADSLAKWNLLHVSVALPGGNAPNGAGIFSTLSENEFIFGALHRGWGALHIMGTAIVRPRQSMKMI
jgi:hypothetical protein